MWYYLPTESTTERIQMISVFVFEGGEGVGDDNTVSVTEWSEAELIRVISEYVGECDGVAWKDQTIELADDNGPKILGDTFEIVNGNLAQAAKCGVDGGQIYVVRCI
jgi:hypothetical protein